jgi:S1-C subfamily serine protease
MKILVIVVTALLVITAAAGGFFIYNLNGQIDSLQTELAQSTSNIGQKIDESGGRLEEEIKNGDSVLSAAIQSANSSFIRFSANTGARFTEITAGIESASNKITKLDVRAAENEAVIAGTVLQTSALYADLKQAIVRITDGTNLIGSGFIMAGNPGTSTYLMNKVVTAYHVIKDLTSIYITLYDGRSWKGVVWASSEAADIAILRFADDNTADLPDNMALPKVALADSWTVKGGDPVFVIGSPGSDTDPLGLSETVTTGIVSYVHRGEIVGDKYVTNLIQIDAPVNFGNSGGPLFNIKGEVIGIVIARMDPTLGDGISFATSSNMIKKVEKNIINGAPGEFKYDFPWLGVGTNDLTPEYITEHNNTITRGAEVLDVTGPAEAAGIQAGDIITGIDGYSLRDPGELSSYVAEYGTPGETWAISVIRNGVALEIPVTLGIRP